MKIIGFVHIDAADAPFQMVLKGDSSLLVNRKPFFTPDWTHDLRMASCIVLRVSRLGKEIAPRFAYRYYDAVAHGADFIAWDILEQARAQGQSWTSALAFDFSLAVGEWRELDDNDNLKEVCAQAIADASRVMTIRQGDLIYIHTTPAVSVIRNEVVEAEGLYCKIK